MRLNLETKSKEQELVKAYLEEKASEILAEKINNGTLFNADGTEYKPAPKPAPAQVGKVEPKEPEQRQATLFDFMKQETAEPEKDYDELTEEEMREFDGDMEEPKDLDDEPDGGLGTSAFDKTALCKLDAIFGDKLTVR